MNYQAWGNEYLQEAERLRNRMDWVKRDLKEGTPEQRDAQAKRLEQLRMMRAECLYTGRHLLERGNRQ